MMMSVRKRVPGQFVQLIDADPPVPVRPLRQI
jgi:hypothetical protein